MRSKYERYIGSAQWAEKRLAIMERAGGVCEKCTKRKARQVHHLTYKNLFDEPLEDLQAVCMPCHQAYHPGKWELEPRPLRARDFQCALCPSTEADLYLAPPLKHFVCLGCGEPQVVAMLERRAPAPPQVECPSCHEMVRSHVRLYSHMEREHPGATIPQRTVTKYRKHWRREHRRKR